MRKFTLSIFSIFFFASGFSQDPYFTNTNQSLVYLNPSFSGKYLDLFSEHKYYYNGFIATLGLKLKVLRVCYTYDNVLFENSGVSLLKPSHEISLSFRFKSKKESIPKFGMENW